MGKNRNHYSFFLYFVFIIFVLLGCRPVRVQMPDGMYGRWKSSAGRPDITLGTDSIGSFAIVHHRIYDGKFVLSVIRFILIHLLKGISVQKVASCFIMTV